MGKMFPYNDIFKSKCRINAIIIATGHGGVSGDQIYPFYLYKNELKKRFNLRLKKKILFTSVDDMLAQIRKNKCDILFIQTPLRIDKKEEINFFKEICSYKDKSRIVYLDSEDGSNMSHFEILPFVDLYVCKQHLVDLDMYLNEYEGGSIISDYIAKRFNFDLKGWYFGSKLP